MGELPAMNTSVTELGEVRQIKHSHADTAGVAGRGWRKPPFFLVVALCPHSDIKRFVVSVCSLQESLSTARHEESPRGHSPSEQPRGLPSHPTSRRGSPVSETPPETQPGQEERVACGLLTPAKVTEPAAWLLGLQCYR